ncbi:hypothetical protein RRG08_036371 [Elysia crispata]|uniref:Uncharacterized protein n=1 Tax=Elysia crispata TaxID=231223 RepID=A0AAE0ZJT6_9GAST|nr:hypothetical protein RRG08_036371 [Elysia crispata]
MFGLWGIQTSTATHHSRVGTRRLATLRECGLYLISSCIESLEHHLLQSSIRASIERVASLGMSETIYYILDPNRSVLQLYHRELQSVRALLGRNICDKNPQRPIAKSRAGRSPTDLPHSDRTTAVIMIEHIR